MITGAIFDMDGLLFDTEKIYQKIWHDIASDYGVTLDESFTGSICGTSGDMAAKMIREYYHVDDASVIFRECGLRMAASIKDHIDIKPGVIEILKFLRSHGVKCVVASGSSTEQISRNLAVAGISELFDAKVGGTELKYGKPNPHIFLYACEKIQCDSHDCLLFEDSINGIIAAHRAESHPIMIPDLVAPTPEIREIAEGIFKDMFEAMEYLKLKYFSSDTDK